MIRHKDNTGFRRPDGMLITYIETRPAFSFLPFLLHPSKERTESGPRFHSDRKKPIRVFFAVLCFVLFVVAVTVAQGAGTLTVTRTIYNNTTTPQNCGNWCPKWRFYNSGGTVVENANFDCNFVGGGLVAAGSNRTDTVTWIDDTPSGGHVTLQIIGLGAEGENGGGGNLTETLYETWGCSVSSSNVPCTTNISFFVRNDSTRSQLYYQSATGAGSGGSGGLDLDPGQSGFSEVAWPCDIASGVRLYRVNVGGLAVFDPASGFVTANGGTDTGATSTGAPTGLPPVPPTFQDQGTTQSQYSPTNALNSGTNSPVLFTTTTNGVLSQQQGDSALYKAVTDLGLQAHQDAAVILAGIDGIYTNADAVALADRMNLSNLLANGIALRGTNPVSIINGETNYALETTMEGISNLLGGWTNAFTRADWRTNAAEIVGSESNNILGLSAESWLSYTNGASMLGDAFGGINTMIPAMSASDDGDGGDEILHVEIGNPSGATVPLIISTSQLDNVLPAGAMARVAFKWAILVTLGICNYKVLVREIRTTLLVPQAHAAGTSIFGTNINVASAVVMAAVIVAAAACLPTVFASGIVSTFAQVSLSAPTTVVSSIATVGYGFVSHYFPLAMMITAIVNHLGFRVASNIMELVACAIVKFAVGL